MHWNDIETPAIVIDLDVMERNLKRVADYAKSHNIRLRPHTKTHKIPALGKAQLDLGAAGLTVAKTTEAEVMLEAGAPDILIAYPVLGPAKLQRLAELAKHAQITIAADSLEAAEQAASINAGIGVLVDIDLGLHRMGVQPEDAPALVSEIRKLKGIEWKGIAVYPGHIKDPDDDAGLEKLKAGIAQVLALLRTAGHEPAIVSGGSTPLLYRTHEISGVDEMKPGTYIFNDRNTRDTHACGDEDCAAHILCTVVSVQDGRMMMDGGSKTFSSDRVATGAEGFGEIVGDPSARFHKMNEEHGYVDTTKAARKYTVGDRVSVLPNHICVAMNLHEHVYGARGTHVENVWEVKGRGKLQ